MSSEAVFSIGDWIVHKNYGVGQIKKLEAKRISGEERMYFRVETSNATYWFQSENTTKHSRVRPVVTKKDLHRALRLFGEEPHELPRDYKQRQSQIRQIISIGSLEATVSLVRDLSSSNLSGRLSISEKEILERLKKRLVNEWSVVMGINPEEARQQLEQSCAQNEPVK